MAESLHVAGSGRGGMDMAGTVGGERLAELPDHDRRPVNDILSRVETGIFSPGYDLPEGGQCIRHDASQPFRRSELLRRKRIVAASLRYEIEYPDELSPKVREALPTEVLDTEDQRLLDRLFRCWIYLQHGAILLLDERHVAAGNAFVELDVWRFAERPLGGRHDFTYRLALVVGGKCVVRYNNESGKGDHRRVGKKEDPYVLSTVRRLPDDFWTDVARWRF